MANDDDYYKGGSPFDGYVVTSVNPGLKLLAITSCYVAFAMLLGMLLRWKRNRKNNELTVKKLKTSKNKLKLLQRKNEDDDSGTVVAGMETLDLVHSQVDMAQLSKDSSFNHIEEIKVERRRKRGMPTRQRRGMLGKKSNLYRGMMARNVVISTRKLAAKTKESENDEDLKRRKGLYVLEFANDSGKGMEKEQIRSKEGKKNSDTRDTVSGHSRLNKVGDYEGDNYTQMTDEEVGDLKLQPNKDFSTELMNMLNLARPWAFTSFVGGISSIIALATISHYIGIPEMICYSYVWFLLDASHIISDAMYNSLYKHANNCVAAETDEGYEKAGKYIRICMFCNNLISIPICIGIVYAIGPFMRMFGYGPKIVNLSMSYTVIAAVNKVTSTCTGFVSIIPDIDGHADFDAMYSLIDSLADIGVAMFVIPIVQPTLIQLGLIHLLQDILSTIVYFSIVYCTKGWFNKYKSGLLGKLDICGKDYKQVSSLLRKTVPLTFDAITGEIEWFVMTFFAGYLGAAEAATWILISSIWEFFGILPDNIASASEYRVSHLLSLGEVPLAKKLSGAAIWITIMSSAACCAILFIFRDVIVSGVTQDETLDGMLLEIIPYIVICDPFISISTATSSLNRALAMYKRSTKVELILTVLVTLPAGFISTYVIGYNIEGIAAATYIGYATMGFFSIVMFANADWNRAAEKNQMMICEEDEDDEEDTEDEEDDKGRRSN